jgi:hypothetical protein
MSKYQYNSWPLGAVPREYQRPEPAALLEAGYHWEDPRDIVDLFEAKLADFAGSKFAVLTDSCSNAIFLCLKLRAIMRDVLIPRQTYASIPMQIIHAGGTPRFTDISWSGAYELGDTKIVDGAGRFRRGMYESDTLHTLSFQIKKRLPIGRGGAILTDSESEYRWLKLASYDGRDLTTPYSSQNHLTALGWHMYMTPEDAARGILLMDRVIGGPLEDTMSFENYPPLTDWEIFRENADRLSS